MSQRLLTYTPYLDPRFGASWSSQPQNQRVVPAAELETVAALLDAAPGATTRQVLEKLARNVSNGRGAELHKKAIAETTKRLSDLRSVVLSARTGLNAIPSESLDRAGRILGAELEGLSPEDQEFEVARGFVRFAADAIGRVIDDRSGAPVNTIVNRAISVAARLRAPGLPIHLRKQNVCPRCGSDGAGACTHVSKPKQPEDRGMHNIDRTQQEFMGEGAFELFEQNEGEGGEAELMELTNELLGVATEEEFEQFLGGLIRRVGRAAGNFVRSPVGQALGGILKNAAKQALPLAGGALGSFVGGPVGAMLGRKLAGFAADRLEVGEMSEEEQEYEGARAFVNFAADAVKRAVANAATGDARQVAQQAAIGAARSHLPGLMQNRGSGGPAGTAVTVAGRAKSGRWVRRGNSIIILGA